MEEKKQENVISVFLGALEEAGFDGWTMEKILDEVILVPEGGGRKETWLIVPADHQGHEDHLIVTLSSGTFVKTPHGTFESEDDDLDEATEFVVTWAKVRKEDDKEEIHGEGLAGQDKRVKQYYKVSFQEGCVVEACTPEEAVKIATESFMSKEGVRVTGARGNPMTPRRYTMDVICDPRLVWDSDEGG